MKRTTRWLATLLVAGGTALAGMSQAKADLLSESASGAFSTSGTTNTSLSGGGTTLTIAKNNSWDGNYDTITFTGASVANVSSGPINLGTFKVDRTGAGGALTGSGTVAFTLTITQTNPVAGGPGSFTSTLSGDFYYYNLWNSSNDLQLTFTSGTTTIGGVTYNLILGSGNTFDLPGSSHGKNSTLQANIVFPVAVPEPSSLAIAGISALVGCGYGWRRRNRNAA